MLFDQFRLTDRVAVITGGGRGIGAAIALAYAEAGADVAIAARSQDQLDEIASQVEGLGRRALVVACDLNDTSNLERLVDQAIDTFGRLDIVVCVEPPTPRRGIVTVTLLEEEIAVYSPHATRPTRPATWGPWVLFR